MRAGNLLLAFTASIILSTANFIPFGDAEQPKSTLLPRAEKSDVTTTIEISGQVLPHGPGFAQVSNGVLGAGLIDEGSLEKRKGRSGSRTSRTRPTRPRKKKTTTRKKKTPAKKKTTTKKKTTRKKKTAGTKKCTAAMKKAGKCKTTTKCTAAMKKAGKCKVTCTAAMEKAGKCIVTCTAAMKKAGRCKTNTCPKKVTSKAIAKKKSHARDFDPVEVLQPGSEVELVSRATTRAQTAACELPKCKDEIDHPGEDPCWEWVNHPKFVPCDRADKYTVNVSGKRYTVKQTASYSIDSGLSRKQESRSHALTNVFSTQTVCLVLPKLTESEKA